MITSEAIKSANQRVAKIEIGTGNKKKFYTSVAARVAAFREMCADGSITTDIISMADGVVTIKATVADETGRVLATGTAQEKESSSFINKTSYIENCETSAVGRALGMLGIGSDEQMASAEELANAINNQNQAAKAQDIPPVTNETVHAAVDFMAPADDIELAELEALAKTAWPTTPIEKIFPKWPHLTKGEYVAGKEQINNKLKKKAQ